MWRAFAGAIGLWCLCTAGQVQANAQTAPPAEIIAATHLGPKAGNGTRPVAATVDVRRNRIWVLSSAPLSFSIVDVPTRRVLDVIALPSPTVPAFDGWGNSEPRVWIGYDRRADCVLICKGNISTPSTLVSVDAGTRHVVAVRTFTDRRFYRCAFNAKRSEICAVGLGQTTPTRWNLLTLDARTLQTHIDLPMTRTIETLAASPSTGRLYTVEPSYPDPAALGRGGPYSATRVYERNTATGAIVSQSPEEYPYPHSLFVDDTAGKLYLVHGNMRERDLVSSFSSATTVSILTASSLKRERRIRYAAPEASSGQSSAGSQRPLVSARNTAIAVAPASPLEINLSFLDVPHHRLIASVSGKIAVLPLTGKPEPFLAPAKRGSFSPYGIAGILPHTEQAIYFVHNAVGLLNTQTLQPGPGVTLGAMIQILFLDRKRHRLLAYVDRNVQEFLMLEKGTARRLFKASLPDSASLLAVDFDRERIYRAHRDGWGGASLLLAADFHGKPVKQYRAVGEFNSLLLTGTPNRSFRLLFPAYPEGTKEIQHRSLDLLQNGREIKSVSIPQPPSMNAPSLALYAPQADRIYIVLDNMLTTYSGKDLSILGSFSLAPLMDEEARRYNSFRGGLAVDEAGRFAYYADPSNRQIVKLQLADGAVVARRSLSFVPSLPLVDKFARRLYLADNDGGRIVALRLF